MNCFEKYLDYAENSTNTKEAFAKIAYYMYLHTEKHTQSEHRLYENDFFIATDDELAYLLSFILDNDESLREKYNRISSDNIFDCFYNANKELAHDMVAPIAKSLNKLSKTLDMTQLQGLADQHNRFLNSFNKQFVNTLSSVNFNRIVEIQSIQFNSLAKQLGGIDFSYINEFARTFTTGLQSLINSIPKYNFAEVISPLVQQISEIQNSFAPYYRSAVEQISNALSNIDFSMLSYHREWNEKHDILIKHGWFYLNELPDEIIDEIYNQEETITSDHVNVLICNYFRENNCAALKKIVKTWRTSSYFQVREHLFHQALVNHSRHYYNTAITLLALHTEGIITDFMRIKLQTPKFNAKNAVTEIRDTVGDMPLNTLSFSDWIVYDEILERILSAFSENFSLANPDSASNKSRHKIAHGHVIDIETEVNSLKQFLYLNEIYKLFSKLDKMITKSNCPQNDEDSPQA